MVDESKEALGHPEVSIQELNIAGLQTRVFGLEEIKDSSLPIAVVFVLHGRGGNQKHMEGFCHGMLGEISACGEGNSKSRDVIALTMDQRNHGTRLVEKRANLGYDENPAHLVDMTACVMGGAQDVSFVTSLLEAYLFPLGERRIDEYIVSGHSLGGHVVWKVLVDDPRISIAIPLQGLPFESQLNLLRIRAEKMGIPFKPPTYPPAMKPIMDSSPPGDAYKGKKILSIHGQADELVPYSRAAEVISAIKDSARPGEVEVVNLERVGHEVTEEMVRRTAQWVWRWALSK